MKLVVPMAGRGSRFVNEAMPKPLIEVSGRPMIEWAMAGLDDLDVSGLIFVALREHDVQHQLCARLRAAFGEAIEIVLIDDVTEGQLCTVLCARHLLDPDEDVLVAGCDTFVRGGLAEAIAHRPADVRGILSVAELPGDRWSFTRLDEHGDVVEVAEKRRIAPWACTGLYYFASAAELLTMADRMIAADDRSRGEFFVTPLYKYFLDAGMRVRVAVADIVADMGTPDAARDFEQRFAAGEIPDSRGARG